MNIGDNDKEQIKRELSGEVALSVIKQMQTNNELINSKKSKLDSLQNVIDDYTMNNQFRLELEQKLKVLFPEFDNYKYGIITNYKDNNSELYKLIKVDYKGNTK